MRVGWGFDAHRFGGPGPTLLAGVVVAVAASAGVVFTLAGGCTAVARPPEQVERTRATSVWMVTDALHRGLCMPLDICLSTVYG